MSVVGFDFGDKTCVIAVARRRVVEVVQNETGRRMTASAVAFADKHRVLGDGALAQAMSNYKNTIIHMKRLLGRSYDEAEMKFEHQFLPYRTERLANGRIGVVVRYNKEDQTHPIELITTALLEKLKAVAEHNLDGQPVTDCVISVPPYWHDAQRRALLDAAACAGLNVLRLMNDTTAVALSYGIQRELPQQEIKVAFVDVGHSSTNVGVVSFVPGKLKVLSTASDRNLGARNFDLLLEDYFTKYVQEKYKMNVKENRKAVLKLRNECARIKTVLSANTTVPFNIEYLMNDTDVSGRIERSEFEEMAAKELLPQIIKPCQRALELAGITLTDLAAVEIVGGGSRIPCVQEALANFFQIPLSKTCDSDEAVARGCALQCAMLSPNFKVRDFDVQDSTPLPITVGWGPVTDDYANLNLEDSSELFKVGNSIPSVKLISFKDRTDAFQLTAQYSKPDLLPEGTSPNIGRFVIGGIPADATAEVIGPDGETRPGPRIKVKVKINLNGVIGVASAHLLKDRVVEEEVEVEDDTIAVMDTEDTDAKTEPQPDATAADSSKMETEETGADDSKDAAESKDGAASTDSAAVESDAKKQKTAPKIPTRIEKRKVVRSERIALVVEQTFEGALNKKELDRIYEVSSAMAMQDRLVEETMARRNEVEDYVLTMRSDVSDGPLKEFVDDNTREAFVDNLTKTEFWLEEDGYDAEKSEYIAKLEDLRATGESIKFRAREHEHRDEAVKHLKSVIGHFDKLSSSQDEKYSHITQEERDTVAHKAKEADQWLADSLQQLDKLQKWQDPTVTCKAMDDKRTALIAECSAIMDKPKPKPKKEEKKDEDKSKADGDAKDSADKQGDDASAKVDAETEDAEMTDAKAAEPKTNGTEMDTEEMD